MSETPGKLSLLSAIFGPWWGRTAAPGGEVPALVPPPARRPMPVGVNLLARAAAGGFWSGPIPADTSEPTGIDMQTLWVVDRPVTNGDGEATGYRTP